MRTVIGIGETIYDIIFRNGEPFKAVPGGSTFNCMISLGRCGIPAFFISEMGNDKVGNIIKGFMEENNLSTNYIDFFEDGNSPVSLAFLDEKKNAEYTFFRNFPSKRLDICFPKINRGDIVIFGSYFALNPALRDKVVEFLNYAQEQGAIIYYDINFRKAHAHECIKLMPTFMENFEYSTIIRCSDEDLSNLYPGKNFDEIYNDHISFYCKNFIVTQASQNVILKTGSFEKNYPVKELTPVSTIGAGDNFNAGLIYGILKYNLLNEHDGLLEEKDWDKIIDHAIQFSAEVCLSYDNYVSKNFAELTIDN